MLCMAGLHVRFFGTYRYDRGLLLKVLCGSVDKIIGGESQSENSSMLYSHHSRC